MIINVSRICTLYLGIIGVFIFFGCQTISERLQNENPNRIFLQTNSSFQDIDQLNKVLSFFESEECKKGNLDQDLLFECSAEVQPFLESFASDGLIEKTGERFFFAKSKENIERILESYPIIDAFNSGNIQESLNKLNEDKYQSFRESKILSNLIQRRIQKRSDELINLLEKMIKSDKVDSSLEQQFQSRYSKFYLNQENVSLTADRFLDFYGINQRTECNIQTIEPDSQPFVMEGFEDDVEARMSCSPKFNKRIMVQISGNRFVNVGSSWDNQELLSVFGESDFSYSVKSLSQNKDDNNVLYSLLPSYKSTIDLLVSSGKKFQFLISLQDSNYNFQKTPRSFSPEYDRWEGEFSDSSEVIGSINNGNISSTMDSKGKFTMGGQNADGVYDLMFGHPNGKYSDGIWSSFTAIKVDDEVFRLSEFNHDLIEMGEERIELQTILGNTGIRIHSIWEKPNGIENALNLGYRIVNTNNSTKKVGIRLFLDTWAGYSDGVPFALPVHNGIKDRIVTEEISFNPHTSAIWETTDVLDNGNVFLQNLLAGDSLTPPDEVQFVNWGSAIGTLWDYQVSETRSVTGDSAVALIWEPREIPKGKEKSIFTRFLSIQRAKDYSFQSNSKSTSSGILVVNKDFGNCKNLNLKLTQEEGIPLTREGKSDLNFELNPEQKSNIQIPLTLHGFGETRLNIEESCDGLTKRQSIMVKLPEEDYSAQIPLAEKNSVIPVQFTSKISGRKLEARLVNSITFEVLTKTSLIEKKRGNLFLYTGELTSSFEGGFLIEYLDLDVESKSLSSFTKSNEKDEDLKKNFAKITLRNGDTKNGKIISDTIEEIEIEINSVKEKHIKRELKSIRYGR